MEKHLRKEKLRKAKKKTQPKVQKGKPRYRNWTPRPDQDWEDDVDIEDERIMPRGSQEKRSQTAQVAESVQLHESDQKDDSDSTEVGEDFLPGIVIEIAANRCKVLTVGEILDCSFRRVMLKHESAFTNLAAVGDEVLVSEIEPGVGVVEAIQPRRNLLARPVRMKANQIQQIVAANIDRVLIVAAWQKPAIWPELIDRYLIAAERNHLEAVICVNKVDLVDEQPELEAVIQPYRQAGYQVLLTSAETGAGIEPLRALLQGSVTVFTGLSGVGKSSLLSRIQPGLTLRALEVGDRGKNRNQGRHTTTMATLYPLEDGGAVIDTPGIREFGLAFLSKRELSAFYPEFVSLGQPCAYADCTHTHEPDCAVKVALDDGRISQMRYENYQKILSALSN